MKSFLFLVELNKASGMAWGCGLSFSVREGLRKVHGIEELRCTAWSLGAPFVMRSYRHSGFTDSANSGLLYELITSAIYSKSLLFPCRTLLAEVKRFNSFISSVFCTQGRTAL